MLKKFLLGSLLSCILLSFTACANNNESAGSNPSSKIKVVVTFNAMREFASVIGKDKINIITIIPDGTEPHDFEPKPKDLINISDAKVFVYNGFGMETWVPNALKVVDNKNLIVVESAEGSQPISNIGTNMVSDHGQYDPHLWLSLKGAESQSKNIKDALVKVDPVNKDFYENNYKSFYIQLNALYLDYSKKFQDTANKSFVTGHAAFAYLCRDFGLKQNSVEDVFADGEPSAKQLKDLIDYCKTNKIKTIFVEDMVSPKVSDTLASEVGAKVEKIHTVEGKTDNKDYTQCMKENLELIYNSLK